MERQYGYLYPKIVFVLDFICLNFIVSVLLFFSDELIVPESVKWIYFVLNISFLPFALYLQRFHTRRLVHFELIVLNALFTAGLTGLLFLFLSEFLSFIVINMLWLICFQVMFFFALSLSWFFERMLLKSYRQRGGNFKCVVIIGSQDNAMALYNLFSTDMTLGYRVLGYFAEDDASLSCMDANNGCLGALSDLEEYVKNNKVDEIYSTLSATRGNDILNIIHMADNYFIRYYFIPNFYNYLKRKVSLDYLGGMPILSIRQEPLLSHWNSMLKRSVDIVFSLIVLSTIFPFFYIVVGSIIKMSSKGPVLFKQLRTGLNGKEFYCYKFRSMKVNIESDQLQATKEDPRKTRIGEFIRKTSIDEIPQFINVIKGEMSVVGPRPHMLKHTEMYSQLVEKYMLRHFVKPGITGWAQVNGCRGETKAVEEMAKRVKFDIFYIENWSMLMDIKIIFRTIFQVTGDKQAY